MTNAILDDLNRLYPNKEVPHGSYSLLATKHGVTRAYVSGIAKTNGFIVTVKINDRPRDLTKECAEDNCSIIVGHTMSKYCAEHKDLHFKCGTCGKDVHKSRAEMNRRLKSTRYTTKVYCDRTCFGVSMRKSADAE